MRTVAEFFDESAKLVSVDPRRADFVADRRIPVVDVLVGSADCSGGDADQDFVGTRLRNGAVADGSAFRSVRWGAFYDSLHDWKFMALRAVLGPRVLGPRMSMRLETRGTTKQKRTD